LRLANELHGKCDVLAGEIPQQFVRLAVPEPCLQRGISMSCCRTHLEKPLLEPLLHIPLSTFHFPLTYPLATFCLPLGKHLLIRPKENAKWEWLVLFGIS